jgi:hypothetical protein
LSRVRSSSILAARIFPEERRDHVGQRSARPIVLERDADERAAVGPGLEAHGAERLLLTCWRAALRGAAVAVNAGLMEWGGPADRTCSRGHAEPYAPVAPLHAIFHPTPGDDIFSEQLA